MTDSFECPNCGWIAEPKELTYRIEKKERHYNVAVPSYYCILCEMDYTLTEDMNRLIDLYKETFKRKKKNETERS